MATQRSVSVIHLDHTSAKIVHVATRELGMQDGTENSGGSNTLRHGAKLSRSEFHALYEATEPSYRAELIGGVVHEPSQHGWDHGVSNSTLAGLLVLYTSRISGTRIGKNVTVILSDEDEVQPDLILRAVPGQTEIKDNYVVGAPEFVVEVSDSSKRMDLRLKKVRYAKAGVLEYVVLCLKPAELLFFDLKANQEFQSDNGVFKSVAFPGLWLDVRAILKNDYASMFQTLELGLSSR